MSGALALNNTEEAINVTKKQGMVSILGSDNDQRPTTKGCSIRRTLSADMSSKKWLTQHGLVSPLKKIASSKEFFLIPSITDSSSEEEEDYKEKIQSEKPGQFDIWSSIVSKKDDDEASKSLPPPYVHPLVKRSRSCLSEKSLEICTESLGSETGSDGFSSYPPSETSDAEEERKEEDNQQTLVPPQQSKAAIFDDVKCRYDVIAKKSPRYGSFPPPITSLSRKDGGSVRMETHRDNGRLVLEAVSVPWKNNFLAQRQDGRLVLTFANTIDDEVMVDEEEIESSLDEEKVTQMDIIEEEIESSLDEEKVTQMDIIEEEIESSLDEEKVTQMDIIEEEVEEDMCCEMEQGPKLSSGAMDVHRLAVMMNKPIWLANRNPTWPKTFDEIVKFGDGIVEKVEPTTPLPPPSVALQSLPPRPRVAKLIPSSTPPPSTAAAKSFNAYEYYWRRPNEPMSPKAKATTFITPLAQQSHTDKQLMLSKNQTANDQQQLLVLRGYNGGYFVPLLKGCKETRRSLIFLDPYCIATS